MADIDLIPHDYRIGIQQRRLVIRFGLAVLALLVCSSGALATILVTKHNVNLEITNLEQKKTISTQQRDQLTQLQAEQKQYQQQFELLNGLRSGAAVQRIFVTIDKALDDQSVWFQHWKFQRAGSLIEHKEAEVQTGYIIILPADDKTAVPKAWQIHTHMTITGQALDHAALSHFVRRLLDQPEVEDVRVLKTVLRRYTKTNVVDFDLAIVVDSRVES